MTAGVTIYHNPNCSKSREALEYLKLRGIEPEVVLYLDAPPSIEDLRVLTRKLGVAPSSLIRPADFERVGLPRTSNAEELLAMITANPVILHRPIVVVGNNACVARPPQLMDDLLSSVEAD